MKMTISIRPLLYISLFALMMPTSPAWAQGPAASMAKSKALQGATISAVAVDLVSGEVLDAYRENDKLCPASVWKVLTAGAALNTLGRDFRFRTLLVYQGRIEGRTLHGDVLIMGGGDPLLGSRHKGPGMDALLAEWTTAIAQLGIDSIAGNVIGNAAHFQGDGIPRTRIWEDMANYYGASTSGLNFADNTYFVSFKTPEEPNVPASITAVRPEVPHLEIESEVLTSTIQSDLAYIFGAPGSTSRMVRGTLPMGRAAFEIKGSLPDPPLFAAFHLHKALTTRGIYVSGSYAVEHKELREPPLAKTIVEHVSPPLHELVARMLVESDNLIAETLLFQIGLRKGNPTLEGGIEALQQQYSALSADAKPFFAYDGSGLSRFNAVSAALVAKVLVQARNSDALKNDLLGTMPLAGKEGTVKYFARNTNLDGNMRAKSGSMDKVKAYAGSFTAHTGREIGYTVMVNNFDASSVEVRKAIEHWLLSLYGAH